MLLNRQQLIAAGAVLVAVVLGLLTLAWRSPDGYEIVTADVTFATGIAVDGHDNVYVTSRDSQAVYKIDKTGRAAVLAGHAVHGGDADGQGASARFLFPAKLVIGRDGTLYVPTEIDLFASTHTPGRMRTMRGVVRTISPDGRVGTVAATNSASLAPQVKDIAPFWPLTALAIDRADKLYLAELYKPIVQTIAPSGRVSTLVKDSLDAAADPVGTQQPEGIAVNSTGEAYFSYRHAVFRIARGGAVTVFAGTPGVCKPDDGAGAAAGLCDPGAMAFDHRDNLYVIDGYIRVRKITPGGAITTIASAGINPGPGVLALPDKVWPLRAVAINQRGDLYLAGVAVLRIPASPLP